MHIKTKNKSNIKDIKHDRRTTSHKVSKAVVKRWFEEELQKQTEEACLMLLEQLWNCRHPSFKLVFFRIGRNISGTRRNILLR